MKNNQQFLEVFNKIEDYLQSQTNSSGNDSFYYLLNHVSKDNKVVNHYRAELNTLRELRNFIVHSDIKEPLVNVSNTTVIRIKEIEKALAAPKKIRDVFVENVVGLNEDDTLTKVLEVIKDKKYSQFPVFNKEGFNGLVTENGIINWLANNVDQDTISIKDTKVSDIMIDDEECDSYKFLYAYNSLYDVIREFETGRNTHRRSFVIIVLKRKNDHVMYDDVYTILTPTDLTLIYKSLGLRQN